MAQHIARVVRPPARSSLAKTSSTFFSLAFLFLATAALMPSTVSAADPGKALTLTFLDDSGAVIGQAQTISYALCTNLDISQLTATNGTYTSISTSDPQAALNLYSGYYCQVLASSTVGRWTNTGPVANMIAIRWEGTAPSSLAPGTVRPEAFPKEMAVQAEIPDPDADPVVWDMDPEKGKMIVGLVAGVLVVGVLLGVYQVYKAAQYVPPPMMEKKSKGLNTKKIKKKDAYFKKPMRGSESPEPLMGPNAMTGMAMSSRPQSQLSEAATFVDWNHQQQQQQQQQSQRSQLYKTTGGSDSVSIDMRETRYSPSPFKSQQHGSSTAELIQFDNYDTKTHGYEIGSSSSSSNRGRGGEVLVPMHTFENNYQHPHQYHQQPQQQQQQQYQQHYGRSAMHRSSSSRSR